MIALIVLLTALLLVVCAFGFPIARLRFAVARKFHFARDLVRGDFAGEIGRAHV